MKRYLLKAFPEITAKNVFYIGKHYEGDICYSCVRKNGETISKRGEETIEFYEWVKSKINKKVLNIECYEIDENCFVLQYPSFIILEISEDIIPNNLKTKILIDITDMPEFNDKNYIDEN